MKHESHEPIGSIGSIDFVVFYNLFLLDLTFREYSLIFLFACLIVAFILRDLMPWKCTSKKFETYCYTINKMKNVISSRGAPLKNVLTQ